ncbi:hypothetical protein CVT25_000012 [Psilocybe cyanescens]|uniref:Dystroglycan-type cadherin-like domain-containing protein n=1 Tax=Psilocybe cyanescens TaxID=93625 RepID=A0A409X8G1_PSICY|nr:hypothetical protein CVT25_000012 [Psilocybe cyanescens]
MYNNFLTTVGGQPPFNLLMIPPGQILRNITIPSTAFTSNSGTYTLQLPLAEHQRVLFAVSDSTGVTAGGISTLYDYPNAIQPVTIIGFIPQNQPLIFHPPTGDSFSWNPVNLTAGTSIAFYMTDSQGRNGGIADIEVVRLSDDQSCMATSSSTNSSPNSSPTGTIQPDSTIVPKPKSGLIAGVVAGVVVLILVFVFVAVFCVRRRRKQGTSGRRRSARRPIDPIYDQAGSPAPEGASYLMFPTQYTITPLTATEPESMTARSRKRQLMQSDGADDQSFPSGSSRNQMMAQYPPSAYTSSEPPSHFGTSGHSSLTNGGDPSGISTFTNSDPRSQYKPPPRLIVHTDITETAHEPLELPPQYSEGRAPIPGLVTSNESQATLSQSSSSRPGKNMRS